MEAAERKYIRIRCVPHTESGGKTKYAYVLITGRSVRLSYKIKAKMHEAVIDAIIRYLKENPDEMCVEFELGNRSSAVEGFVSTKGHTRLNKNQLVAYERISRKRTIYFSFNNISREVKSVIHAELSGTTEIQPVVSIEKDEEPQSTGLLFPANSES